MISISLKDMECSVINIFDTETGEDLGQIDDVKSVKMTLEYKTDYAQKDAKNILSFNHDPSYTITFDINEPINTEELYKVLGVDTSNMPDAYDIQYVKIVQVRKHKKRRINKKWTKRYGYKQVVVDSKGWKIKNNTDGSIELVK